MAWDSTRPVPWRRLVRDWLMYAAIMAAVFLLFFRDDLTAGPFIGLLISGPIFVALGALLAKFGYQRKTLRDLRAETAAREQAAAATSSSGGGGQRQRPAPTKRTSTGPGQAKRGSGKRR